MSIIFKRLILFLPWSIIFFIPQHSRKRFTPITLFSTLLCFIFLQYGQFRNFWFVKNGDDKKLGYNISCLLLGFFPIGNYIICNFFFGKFKLFLLGNFILNLLYCIFGFPFVQKLKILQYKKFNRLHHMLLTMTIAITGYGYQRFLERNNFMKGIKKS